jgi:hypothetical protein
VQPLHEHADGQGQTLNEALNGIVRAHLASKSKLTPEQEQQRAERELQAVDKQLYPLQDEDNKENVRLEEIARGLKSVYSVAKGNWIQIRYLALEDYHAKKPIIATILDEQDQRTRIDLVKDLNIRTESDIRAAVRRALEVASLCDRRSSLKAKLRSLEKQLADAAANPTPPQTSNPA